MTIHKCDRCGAEIPIKRPKTIMEPAEPFIVKIIPDPDFDAFQDCDLCEDCYAALRKWLNINL